MRDLDINMNQIDELIRPAVGQVGEIFLAIFKVWPGDTRTFVIGTLTALQNVQINLIKASLHLSERGAVEMLHGHVSALLSTYSDPS